MHTRTVGLATLLAAVMIGLLILMGATGDPNATASTASTKNFDSRMPDSSGVALKWDSQSPRVVQAVLAERDLTNDFTKVTISGIERRADRDSFGEEAAPLSARVVAAAQVDGTTIGFAAASPTRAVVVTPQARQWSCVAIDVRSHDVMVVGGSSRRDDVITFDGCMSHRAS